jgi:hypothetical protein
MQAIPVFSRWRHENSMFEVSETQKGRKNKGCRCGSVVVECLSNMYKALGLIPAVKKDKEKAQIKKPTVAKYGSTCL